MTEDLGPLRPLTPDEQAKFDSERETGSVIQHKCSVCNAWYETPKGNNEFTESFFCDCGAFLSFKVPPMDRLTMTDEALIAGSPDGRLDTGMKVSEAIKKAELWWQKTGRKQAQTELKRQSQPLGADKGNGGAFASQNPEDPNFLPSGLIHGEPWDTLTKREKLMIVKAHHHEYVRKPQGLKQ